MSEKRDDLLIDKAKKMDGLGKLKPSILETNLAYFILLCICSLSILLLPVLNGALHKNSFVGLSVLSLIFSITFFVLGKFLTFRRSIFKLFYFVDFIFISFSILFSVLAVTTFNEIELNFFGAVITLIILLTLSLLHLLVLSLNKKEKLSFFSLLFFDCLAIFLGALLLFKFQSYGIGLPLFAYSLVLLFLHLSMLIYVFSGENFYELMSFCYLLIGIIVLIIALIVISGGDGCDGGCCDCGDCGGGGGRRAKAQNGVLKSDNILIK